MKVRQPDQGYGFFWEKIPPPSTWRVGPCLLGNVSSLLRGDQKTRLSSGFSQPKSIWKPCLWGLPSGTSWNRCYRRSGSERDQDFVLATHPWISRHLPGRLRRCCVQCCHSVAQSCPTLCDPMDCSMPGLPVGGKDERQWAEGGWGLLESIDEIA